MSEVQEIQAAKEPDADSFRAGDVWENSVGTQHRVLRVAARVAHMVNLKTSRTCHRAWDDLGWKTGRPWTRVSSGAVTSPRPADPKVTKRGGVSGFACSACGQWHPFGVYVYAHMNEELIHTCTCGAKHAVQHGAVRAATK